MDKIHKDMLRGHLDGLVLSILERGDGYGYDILQRLRVLSTDTLQLKEGSLYPALYRLEEASFIKAKWDESEEKRKGPRKRIYTITSKGKKSLAKHREQWEQFTEVIGNILGAPS